MTRQLNGIQVLRFAAAMLVVLMHITQAVSTHITGQGPEVYWKDGSAGVDIFFVISGFVMALSTRASPSARPLRLQAAWVFLQRRLLRIVPLYWFYTLLKVGLLLAAPALAVRSSVDPGHLASSLLFIPAMNPAGQVWPVLPVGWTLNFEMLFYAVFAIAIAVGAPRIRFCLGIFVAIFLAGGLLPESVPLAFYAQTIVFEFLLGACIAYGVLRHGAASAVAGLLALAAGAAYMFGIDWGLHADRLLTWGLGAALLVQGSIWLEPWLAGKSAVSRLAFLGDGSYSIYLSHTFVVPACVMAMKHLGMQNSLSIVLLTSLATILAGSFSYVWIERPMTNFLKRTLFEVPRLSYQESEK